MMFGEQVIGAEMKIFLKKRTGERHATGATRNKRDK